MRLQILAVEIIWREGCRKKPCTYFYICSAYLHNYKS